MQTYTEQIKSPKWQKVRLSILQRDNFTCQCCGDTESNLQVHHKIYYPNTEIWDYIPQLLITLCNNCHSNITFDKKQIKYIIDTVFVYDDEIRELKNIIKSLQTLNPYDLSIINKSINSYVKNKNKLINKINKEPNGK